MAFPYDTKKIQIDGPMASNAIAGTGDMFQNTADINFGPASPPAGGVNASSMIAGAKKPGLFSTAKAMPRAGYALGRAAQAIMGPYQNSPAALLGGVGAELSQQEAQRRTAARLLAGENLEDIEEASVLSPQQQQLVLGQSFERRKQNFEETKFKTEMEAKWADLRQKGQLTDAQVENLRAEAGFTKKKVESFETPAEARAAQTESESRLIRERGDQQVRVAKIEQKGAMDRLKQGHTWSVAEKKGIGEQFQNLFLGILGTREVEPKDATNLTMGLMNKLAELTGEKPPFEIEEPVATPTTEGAPKRVYRTQEEWDKRDEKAPKPSKGNIVAVPGSPYAAPSSIDTDKRPDWLKRVEDEGYGTKDKEVVISNPSDFNKLHWLPDGTYVILNGLRVVVKGGKPYAAE